MTRGEMEMSVYELNRLLYDLRLPENRQAIKEDIRGYMHRYQLSATEERAVEELDWMGLVAAGASVYTLTKLGAALGVRLIDMGASMRGITIDEFDEFLATQNAALGCYTLDSPPQEG